MNLPAATPAPHHQLGQQPSQQLSQQLQANLQAQHDCASELLSVLGDEHAALLASDVERLERVTRAKADAAGTLQQLGAAFTRLRGSTPLETLLASLPSKAPASLWRMLRTLATQCQQANQNNALLLSARESQLRQTLRALRPADSPELYGRRGYAAPALGGRRFGAA